MRVRSSAARAAGLAAMGAFPVGVRVGCRIVARGGNRSKVGCGNCPRARVRGLHIRRTVQRLRADRPDSRPGPGVPVMATDIPIGPSRDLPSETRAAARRGAGWVIALGVIQVVVGTAAVLLAIPATYVTVIMV